MTPHRSLVVAGLESAVRDLAGAFRSFRRTPGFFAVAVLILALGIGTTVAVFSVAAALLLRPLPYPESERLVTLRSVEPAWVGACATLLTACAAAGAWSGRRAARTDPMAALRSE